MRVTGILGSFKMHVVVGAGSLCLVASSVEAASGRAETPVKVEPAGSSELAARLAGGKLGFSKLIMVQRHELNPTHVYTYHVEGFQAGGGLCIYPLGSTTSECQAAATFGDGPGTHNLTTHGE